MRQKGFALFPILIITVLLGVVGYFIYQNYQLKKGQNVIAPTTTPKTASPSPSGQTANPTEAAQQSEILTYELPKGWQIIADKNQNFEIGYNPQNMSASSVGDSSILIQIKRSPPLNGYQTYARFSLLPYDGGSRHSFIYKQLGYASEPPISDRTQAYSEKNYTYNKQSCLVLYGLSFSASGTTWGMCIASSKQALFIEGPSSQSETETLIGTIKFLR